MATKNMAKTLKQLWKTLEDVGAGYGIHLLAINIEEELITIKYQCETATVPLIFLQHLWVTLLEYNLTEDVQVNFLRSGEYREIEVLITHGK